MELVIIGIGAGGFYICGAFSLVHGIRLPEVWAWARLPLKVVLAITWPIWIPASIMLFLVILGGALAVVVFCPRTDGYGALGLRD